MATFRRIPETVDARQFTGGETNGLSLAFWVNSNEGKAEWADEHVKFRSGDRKGMVPEAVHLFSGPYQATHEKCYVGDWIMRRQDGSFEVVRQQVLDSDFEQV